MEAGAQAELSSVMHNIEEEVMKEVENMRLESSPALQALEKEEERESRHFHDTSVGRVHAKEKMEARFERQKEEVRKRHESRMVEAREKAEKASILYVHPTSQLRTADAS